MDLSIDTVFQYAPQLVLGLIGLWLASKVYKVTNGAFKVIEKAPARALGFTGLLASVMGGPYAVSQLWEVDGGLSIGAGLGAALLAIASAAATVRGPKSGSRDLGRDAKDSLSKARELMPKLERLCVGDAEQYAGQIRRHLDDAAA